MTENCRNGAAFIYSQGQGKDGREMKYVVVDFEMNPVSKKYKEQKAICTNEIIQIGAVLLDDNYEEMDSFQTYVKPCFSAKLRRHIVKLTGITDARLQKAPGFSDAIKAFFEWCLRCGDEIQIIQWSESDHHQITGEIRQKQYRLTEQEEALMSGWHDFQREYGDAIGTAQETSLTRAVMLTGEEFEGKRHDALYDARNTARIFRIVRIPEEREKSLDKVIFKLKENTPLVSTLGDLFDFSKICVVA